MSENENKQKFTDIFQNSSEEFWLFLLTNKERYSHNIKVSPKINYYKSSFGSKGYVEYLGNLDITLDLGHFKAFEYDTKIIFNVNSNYVHFSAAETRGGGGFAGVAAPYRSMDSINTPIFPFPSLTDHKAVLKQVQQGIGAVIKEFMYNPSDESVAKMLCYLLNTNINVDNLLRSSPHTNGPKIGENFLNKSKLWDIFQDFEMSKLKETSETLFID